MALTTLDNVKQWLGITSPNDDALLTRMIAAASAFCESQIGQAVLSAPYVDTRDGDGKAKWVFSKNPVTAVTSVLVDGVPIPIASPASTGLGYIFARTLLSLRGYVFTCGVQNVVVSYTAGFATVPADIEQACIELISLRYKEKDRIGHVSKTLAGETIAFTQKDMTDSIRTALFNYRNVTPV